jgi:hypothetical protein
VADLLAVIDVCIEASEARTRLLETRGMGTSWKEDCEVNTADRYDRKDRGDREYHSKHSSEQKEKKPFRHPDDAEKWCEVHCTAGHNLEECKTFLYQKKMPPPAALAPQEPQLVDQCWANSDRDEQMGEINVIFGCSKSITSMT